MLIAIREPGAGGSGPRACLEENTTNTNKYELVNLLYNQELTIITYIIIMYRVGNCMYIYTFLLNTHIISLQV